MRPTPHPERAVGEVGASPLPRWRWWQHPAIRIGAGLVVTLGLLAVLGWFPLAARWRWHLSGSSYVEIEPSRLHVYVGLLLVPFLRKVSYRKRDVLLIALVPVYGQLMIGKVVYRLLGLPRRDWPPRPDEVDRAVRIPREAHLYVLRPSFADAEALRARWCVNPRHQHPYDTWAAAHQIGCTRP